MDHDGPGGVLRSRGVPALLATSFVGRLPTAMSALALVRLVVDDGGGYGYASVLSSAYIVAGMIGQPALARVVDRTGHRRPVLAGAAVVATLAFCLTAAVVGTPWLAVAGAATAGLSTPPIEPTLRSLWPQLVSGPSALRAAYGVDATVQEIGFVLGPLVTALGIAALGAEGNVVLMGAVGLVGGLLFASRREVAGSAAVGVEGRHGSPLTSSAFRRLVLVVTGVAAPVGALTVLATAYAERAGAPSIGPWALALNAAGALAGALLVSRFPPRRPPADLVRPVAVVLGVLYLPLAVWTLPTAAGLAAAAVAGLSLPPFLTQVFAQTPSAVVSHHVNEANAWVISAFSIGATTGTLLAGFAVEWQGARGIGGALVVAAALAVGGATAARPRRLALG